MHVTTVCFKHNGHWLLSRVQGCCLEPKWQWPFWYSAAPFRTSSCIHPIDGVVGSCGSAQPFRYQHEASRILGPIHCLPLAVRVLLPSRMVERWWCVSRGWDHRKHQTPLTGTSGPTSSCFEHAGLADHHLVTWRARGRNCTSVAILSIVVSKGGSGNLWDLSQPNPGSPSSR